MGDWGGIQVAKRHRKLARHEVSGIMRPPAIRPERTMEKPQQFIRVFFHKSWERFPLSPRAVCAPVFPGSNGDIRLLYWFGRFGDPGENSMSPRSSGSRIFGLLGGISTSRASANHRFLGVVPAAGSASSVYLPGST